MAAMHSRILILDFGSQVHPADRAPRARGARLLRDPSPTTSTTRSSAPSAPKGVILSGSHASVYDEDAGARRPAVFDARRAGARHLLRHADDGAQLGGKVEAAHRASSATPRCARAATRAARGIQDRATPKATACSTSG
jgi:GMP synthase (glutamine-hydrolysing)